VRLPHPDKWLRDVDLELDLHQLNATTDSHPAEQGAAAAMRAVRELSRK
jgi:hypothetical protein